MEDINLNVRMKVERDVCMSAQHVGAGRAAGVPAVGDGGAELAQREGAGGAGARLGRPAHQPARRAALLRGTCPHCPPLPLAYCHVR